MPTEEKIEPPVKIHKHFTELKLNTDNPGRVLWWYELMKQLEEQAFAVLKFGVNMPPLAGGYFTMNKGIVVIAINRLAAKIENNEVTFTDDKYFSMFVHEASHFQHIVVDRGLCKSPALFKKGKIFTDEMLKAAGGYDPEADPGIANAQRLMNEDLRDLEYEGGWRAVYADKKFKLFPGTRVHLDLQIGNLFMYDLCRQPQEWKDKYRSINDLENHPEKLTDYFHEHCLPLYKKYSEWEDPNHIIKGVLE